MMKKISILFLFVFSLFNTEIRGQNTKTIFDSIINCKERKEIIEQQLLCDSCFAEIIEIISNSDEKELLKSLIVLNILGHFSDGASAEAISQSIYDLFLNFSDLVVKYIYRNNLLSLQSFLLNELCFSINSSKTDILKKLRKYSKQSNVKYEYNRLINSFKKFQCSN